PWPCGAVGRVSFSPYAHTSSPLSIAYGYINVYIGRYFTLLLYFYTFRIIIVDKKWRSCTSPLRIIPSAQKPGTMPHLTTLWRGQGHGLASFLLPTRSVSDRMALRQVASPGVQAKPARPTRAGQAQTQAFYRAQSVRGPDA